jgi:hypothetical protein
MTAQDSNVANAYEGTLTVEMAPTDLTCTVDATAGGPTSPCYLCIEPTNSDRREYVFFDGTFTGTTFVASNINKRYLTGSAAGSGITHPVGAKVRSVPAAQMFEDLHDRIDLAVLKTLADAAGDLLVASGADAFARLGIGTARQQLLVNAAANALEYVASLQSLMTAKGDLVAATAANTPARRAVGSDGAFLKADSGEATGLAWDSTPLLKTLVDAKGDIIAASSADTPARLAVGSDGAFLKADSAQATGLAWDANPLLKTLVDAKGDLLAASAADTVARLAVGANQKRLIADSAEATGLRWGFDTAPVFADATARDAAITAPTNRDWAFLEDVDQLTHYNGTAWITWGGDGEWVSYTPTLAQSVEVTKTVTFSRYMRIGNLVTFVFRLAATSSGSSGQRITVTLPIAADVDTATEVVVGTFNMLDGGAMRLGAALVQVGSGASIGGWAEGGTGYMGSSNPNAAIVSGDVIFGMVTYPVAV